MRHTPRTRREAYRQLDGLRLPFFLTVSRAFCQFAPALRKDHRLESRHSSDALSLVCVRASARTQVLPVVRAADGIAGRPHDVSRRRCAWREPPLL
jgi:hypothetical protein